MIALSLVLARPDLVRSLTLLGSASSFPAAAREGMRARAGVLREQGMAAVVEPSLERWYTAETRKRRPDLMDRVSKTLLGDDPWVQAAIWDIVADLEVTDRLGEILCPALVVVGAEDTSTPPAASEVLATGIRRARLVVVPRAAHLVTVEAPEAVNAALLPFLASIRGERLVG